MKSSKLPHLRTLRKSDRITVRLTADQLRRLRAAAVAESHRRGELIDESALLRELGMKAVEELLAAAHQAIPA